MNKLKRLQGISQIIWFTKMFRHDILMKYELFSGLQFFSGITGIMNNIHVHVPLTVLLIL